MLFNMERIHRAAASPSSDQRVHRWVRTANAHTHEQRAHKHVYNIKYEIRERAATLTCPIMGENREKMVTKKREREEKFIRKRAGV